MSDNGELKEFYGLLKKDSKTHESVKSPNISHEREWVSDDMLAEIRQRERRERKEKLYSYR